MGQARLWGCGSRCSAEGGGRLRVPLTLRVLPVGPGPSAAPEVQRAVCSGRGPAPCPELTAVGEQCWLLGSGRTRSS